METWTAPLPVLISERAKADRDAVAIESLSTGESITWRDFDQRCRLWADAYRRLDVGPQEYVVTLMPNTPDSLYAWLGCAWLRAIEVPVNTDYRGEWLVHALNNVRARVVVVSHQLARWLMPVAERLEHVRVVVVFDSEPDDDLGALEQCFSVCRGEEFFAGAQPATDLPDPQIWDKQCVIYTSGTTGQAKAVLQPWGMAESTKLLFSQPEFQGGAFYGFWPPFHAMGKSVLFPAVANGGKLILRERFSVGEFWDDVRRYDCTGSYVVSVIAGFLYSQPPREDDADNPLKAVIMGPVIPQVDDFKRRFGVNVYTTFGSSETAAIFISSMRDVNGSNWQSCGQHPPNSPVDAAIVDDNDFPVAPGEVGELVVRPKQPWTMSMGYLNMPEANDRAWRNGWFHTGDAFTYDEQGEHYFVDRAKDYIRRRGENISSFEVEQAVCSYPGVSQAAAVGVPSEVGEDEVMVFIVCDEGTSVDPRELLEFLTDKVPKFAIPRFIEIATSLPATQATFRVQKHKLREQGPGPDTFDRLAVAD